MAKTIQNMTNDDYSEFFNKFTYRASTWHMLRDIKHFYSTESFIKILYLTHVFNFMVIKIRSNFICDTVKRDTDKELILKL